MNDVRGMRSALIQATARLDEIAANSERIQVLEDFRRRHEAIHPQCDDCPRREAL
jgi:hypothetical protein